MPRLPTYYMSHKEEIQNILNEDYKALKAKYEKLAKTHQDTGDRVSIAEKAEKMARNKLAKAETDLHNAMAVIDADTDEFRARIEKETVQKQLSMDNDNAKLKDIVADWDKIVKSLRVELSASSRDLLEMTKKFKSNENEITTAENNYKSVIIDQEREIKAIRFNIEESAKNAKSANKYKADNSKLEKEVLVYRGKNLQNSTIIEQLESELKETKKNMKGISQKYSSNNKENLIYKQKIEDLEGKLMLVSGKATRLEKEAKRIIPENIQVTALENKYGNLVGKVVSAKNRITSLNASTPYRPGAVERTLGDVLEDLKNV